MWDLSVPLSPTPSLTLAGITNGASFLNGPVSPGEIFTTFGAAMGSSALAGGTLTGGFVDDDRALLSGC